MQTPEAQPAGLNRAVSLMGADYLRRLTNVGSRLEGIGQPRVQRALGQEFAA